MARQNTWDSLVGKVFESGGNLFRIEGEVAPGIFAIRGVKLDGGHAPGFEFSYLLRSIDEMEENQVILFASVDDYVKWEAGESDEG